MQYEPGAGALLTAVADFLTDEVRPLVKGSDPAMAFRLLIAANLNRIVAGELATEDLFDQAELGRLRELLPEDAVPTPETRNERQQLLRTLNVELTERIRDPDTDGSFLDRARAHLMASLGEKLAVSNPRFSTAEEIE